MRPSGQVRGHAQGDSFGAVIRSRRRHLGLGQGELADLAGVSERFVYALERGKQSVQLDKVLAVLATLGLHLELRRGHDNRIRPDQDLRPAPAQ